MIRSLALILMLGGAVTAFWGTHTLLLRSFGERCDARLLSVDTSDATTEITHQRRSSTKTTGYYRLEIDVSYAFDVSPKPAEAVARASNEPLRRDVRGHDTLHYKVRDPEAQPVKVGDPVAVRYWGFLPTINAADQPRSTLVYGSYALGGGLVLLLVGWFLRSRTRASRAKA